MASRTPCRKIRYDKIGAMWAVAQAKNSGDSYRREIRQYWCKECKAYHLTSQQKYGKS